MCLAGLTTEIHGQLTFISILNIFFSINAFLGNALILPALRKESSLHPPSKLLLRSLAATGLCVGHISEPLHATFFISVKNEHWNISRFVLAARIITDSSYFLWSFSVDSGCNKRGQTSRPVVGAEIQTSCNFKANLCDPHYFLGCVHGLFNNALLE